MTQSIENKILPDITSPLLQWYDAHARILPWRDRPESYAVWISEIMLQQTRVEAVKPYFDRWMKALPDLATLAAASEDEVLKLWEGLGYYSRARNILKTARLVMEKYGGSLPPSYEGLRSLPGIGEYTAGSVGSIAFQLPVPCVDGNVLRVVARITANQGDISTAAIKKLYTAWVRDIIPKDRPGDFNQAMMELGATVCLPNGRPQCELCPVANLCEAHRQNRMTEFPVKSGKAARKSEKKTVVVLLDETKQPPETALLKRSNPGLLAGLWEFPNFEGELSEKDVRTIFNSSGYDISDIVKLKKVKHIFTHIEWDMNGYLVSVKPDSSSIAESKAKYESLPGIRWVGIEELEKQYALPSAFRTYYQILKHYRQKGTIE